MSERQFVFPVVTLLRLLVMKMKSLIKRTVYAGLGCFLGEDNDAVRNLVQEIRRSADVSAISGKKFAHRIQAQSIKAAKAIRQTLDAEVTKVADAIHEAFRKDIAAKASKSASAVKVSTKQVAKATPIGRKLVRA
jgi:hypothetical protein